MTIFTWPGSNLTGPAQFLVTRGDWATISLKHWGNNLPVPPWNFTHCTFFRQIEASYQFISYLELHCNNCLCTKYAPNIIKFWILHKKNNNDDILFSWLERCVLLWTPPGDYAHLLEYIFWLHPCHKYRKTSCISRTKFQNLNVSCILMKLPLLTPLKPGVKLRMKM